MADESTSFHLLDERIRRFIWSQGWQDLRAAQEHAIPLILSGDRDVVIAAPTASGKTEAAFLPALSHLLAEGAQGLIVYVSPLKALINDQFVRLELLCEALDVPVWPWHGEISSSVKSRFAKEPRGVLLITPEALEATLCRRGTAVAALFRRAMFFMVDELHAFIGTERGKQLQSLLHRIETAVDRRVPRIGLSATLGEIRLAAQFLRPGSVASVVESASTGAELRILVKGYEEGRLPAGSAAAGPDPTSTRIATDLFGVLRGSNNLIFPNSRREVERYTHALNLLCEQNQVPSEFWPHHGSLSREVRAATEEALKQRERPATAVCTNTLELGIDIGAVKSVVQIGPPPSVASLRQRMGRSGRREGEAAILRGYSIEPAQPDPASLRERLHLDSLQMFAMVSLMLEGWCEPPHTRAAHFSTLVQQVLSVISQRGGSKAGELYALLCGANAPFANVSQQDFVELLKQLAARELIEQDPTGEILLGRIGEQKVGHYTFFAAFEFEDEYRILAAGKLLGTLPVAHMVTPGQKILFAGRTWNVEAVDAAGKAIHVAAAAGGAPPMFTSGSGRIHTRVRERMRELLRGSEMPEFLDPTARRFLERARTEYAALALDGRTTLDLGREVLLLTWLGDDGNEALACMFQQRGYRAATSGLGVEVRTKQGGVQEVLEVLAEVALIKELDENALLAGVDDLKRAKWDWALPEVLLRKSYATQYLDVAEALAWARTNGSVSAEVGQGSGAKQSAQLTTM